MRSLAQRLTDAMELTNRLAKTLDSDGLSARNGLARSNSIGAQLWCVVGARESYATAFEAGTWSGFSCSLTEPHSPAAVQAALTDSMERFEALLTRAGDDPTTSQESTTLDLLEHEVQHHGQLIRYFYANGFSFPPAFAERYALG